MRRRLIMIGLAAWLLIAAWRPAPTVATRAHYQSPTLLIHGFRAGPHTFDRFIDRAETTGQANLTLTAWVSAHGITYSGHWAKSVRHPLIKVVFTDNHQSWQQNAKGLNRLLRQLKSRYHLHAFDAVAHSRGNLDLLVAYGQAQPLTLRRAVLIAPPADGKMRLNDPLGQNHLKANGQPLYRHGQYRDLVKLRRHFPRTVHVLSIIGNIGNGSDGVLTNVSSQALYPALGTRFASFRQVMVHGQNASHHWIIRRNPRVITRTLHFLWPTNRPTS